MPGSRRRRPLVAACLSTSLALLATIPLAATSPGEGHQMVARHRRLHGDALPFERAGGGGSADAAALAPAAGDRPQDDRHWLLAGARRRVEAHQSGTATVYHAPPPGDPPDSDFDRLAQCESTSRWQLDTGNGYYGGLQFSATTWRGLGGTGLPHEHPRQTQIEMGRRQWRQSGWRAWPHCSKVLGLA